MAQHEDKIRTKRSHGEFDAAGGGASALFSGAREVQDMPALRYGRIPADAEPEQVVALCAALQG